MRKVQIFIGLAIVLLGLLLLVATSGIVAMGGLDVLGAGLILSGVLFVAAGVVWHKTAPWLTALFIPGVLAAAVGKILLYTEHIDANAWVYLWSVLVIGLGLAFLAMYYLGPRKRWLQLLGAFISIVGVLVFALLTILLSSIVTMRVIGAGVLIALGLILAINALMPRR